MLGARLNRISLIRSIAAATALCFGAHEAAAAAPALTASNVPVVAAAVLPLSQLIRQPAQIDIPFNVATLQEVHAGTSGKLIIHIQDAHANLSGQQSLAKAVEHFVSAYGIRVVLVEGADRDVSLDEVRKLAPLQEWSVIARRFLYEGVISGEEYLNLTTEHPMRLRGIEYQDLYDEAVKTYAALVDRRKDVLHYLHKSKVSLDRLKSKMYPAELRRYEERKGADPLGDGAGFADTLKALFALLPGSGLDLAGFPALAKLKETMDREAALDFERANQEQARILGRLGPEEAKTFAEASRRLRHSQVSQYRLTRQLLDQASGRGMDVGSFPELAAYADYLERFLDLKMEQVLVEQEKLEDDLFDRLLPDDDARKVRAIDRFLGLIGNAYKLQMSSHEFAMYEFNEKDFPTESWLGFMNRKLADLGFFESMVPAEDHLEEAYGDFKKFYRLVSDRDGAFVENAARIMNEEKAEAAILIAGGYHTDHLTRLLRDAGDSYIVLTPLVTDTTDHEKYEQILLGHLKDQERRLAAARHKQAGLGRAENVAATKIPRGIRAMPAAARFAEMSSASGARMAAVEKFVEGRKPGLLEGIRNIARAIMRRPGTDRAVQQSPNVIPLALPGTPIPSRPSVTSGVGPAVVISPWLEAHHGENIRSLLEQGLIDEKVLAHLVELTGPGRGANMRQALVALAVLKHVGDTATEAVKSGFRDFLSTLSPAEYVRGFFYHNYNGENAEFLSLFMPLILTKEHFEQPEVSYETMERIYAILKRDNVPMGDPGRLKDLLGSIRAFGNRTDKLRVEYDPDTGAYKVVQIDTEAVLRTALDQAHGILVRLVGDQAPDFEDRKADYGGLLSESRLRAYLGRALIFDESEVIRLAERYVRIMVRYHDLLESSGLPSLDVIKSIMDRYSPRGIDYMEQILTTVEWLEGAGFGKHASEYLKTVLEMDGVKNLGADTIHTTFFFQPELLPQSYLKDAVERRLRDLKVDPESDFSSIMLQIVLAEQLNRVKRAHSDLLDVGEKTDRVGWIGPIDETGAEDDTSSLLARLIQDGFGSSADLPGYRVVGIEPVRAGAEELYIAVAEDAAGGRAEFYVKAARTSQVQSELAAHVVGRRLGRVVPRAWSIDADRWSLIIVEGISRTVPDLTSDATADQYYREMGRLLFFEWLVADGDAHVHNHVAMMLNGQLRLVRIDLTRAFSGYGFNSIRYPENLKNFRERLEVIDRVGAERAGSAAQLIAAGFDEASEQASQASGSLRMALSDGTLLRELEDIRGPDAGKWIELLEMSLREPARFDSVLEKSGFDERFRRSFFGSGARMAQDAAEDAVPAWLEGYRRPAAVAALAPNLATQMSDALQWISVLGNGKPGVFGRIADPDYQDILSRPDQMALLGLSLVGSEPVRSGKGDTRDYVLFDAQKLLRVLTALSDDPEASRRIFGEALSDRIRGIGDADGARRLMDDAVNARGIQGRVRDALIGLAIGYPVLSVEYFQSRSPDDTTPTQNVEQYLLSRSHTKAQVDWLMARDIRSRSVQMGIANGTMGEFFFAVASDESAVEIERVLTEWRRGLAQALPMALQGQAKDAQITELTRMARSEYPAGARMASTTDRLTGVRKLEGTDIWDHIGADVRSDPRVLTTSYDLTRRTASIVLKSVIGEREMESVQINGGTWDELMHFYEQFPSARFTVVNVDEAALRRIDSEIRAKSAQGLAVPDVELHLADASILDRLAGGFFPDASRDLVIAIGLDESVFPVEVGGSTVERALSGIVQNEVRMLRPGGYLLHVTPSEIERKKYFFSYHMEGLLTGVETHKGLYKKPSLSIAVDGVGRELFPVRSGENWSSNPNFIYADSAGREYFVKVVNEPAQAVAERIGYGLFKLLGLPVQEFYEVAPYENGKWAVVSPFEPGFVSANVESPDYGLAETQEAFGLAYYAHAFLNTSDGPLLRNVGVRRVDGLRRIFFTDFDRSLGLHTTDDDRLGRTDYLPSLDYNLTNPATREKMRANMAYQNESADPKMRQAFIDRMRAIQPQLKALVEETERRVRPAFAEAREGRIGFGEGKIWEGMEKAFRAMDSGARMATAVDVREREPLSADDLRTGSDPAVPDATHDAVENWILEDLAAMGLTPSDLEAAEAVLKSVRSIYERADLLTSEVYHNHLHNLLVTHVFLAQRIGSGREGEGDWEREAVVRMLLAAIFHDLRLEKNPHRKVFVNAQGQPDWKSLNAEGIPVWEAASVASTDDLLAKLTQGETVIEDELFGELRAAAHRLITGSDDIAQDGIDQARVGREMLAVRAMIRRTDFPSDVDPVRSFGDGVKIEAALSTAARSIVNRYVAGELVRDGAERAMERLIESGLERINAADELGEDGREAARKRLYRVHGIESDYLKALFALASDDPSELKNLHDLAEGLENADQTSYYAALSPEAVGVVIGSLPREGIIASREGSFPFFFVPALLQPRMLERARSMPLEMRENLMKVLDAYWRLTSDTPGLAVPFASMLNDWTDPGPAVAGENDPGFKKSALWVRHKLGLKDPRGNEIKLKGPTARPAAPQSRKSAPAISRPHPLLRPGITLVQGVVRLVRIADDRYAVMASGVGASGTEVFTNMRTFADDYSGRSAELSGRIGDVAYATSDSPLNSRVNLVRPATMEETLAVNAGRRGGHDAAGLRKLADAIRGIRDEQTVVIGLDADLYGRLGPKALERFSKKVAGFGESGKVHVHFVPYREGEEARVGEGYPGAQVLLFAASAELQSSDPGRFLGKGLVGYQVDEGAYPDMARAIPFAVQLALTKHAVDLQDGSGTRALLGRRPSREALEAMKKLEESAQMVLIVDHAIPAALQGVELEAVFMSMVEASWSA